MVWLSLSVSLVLNLGFFGGWFALSKLEDRAKPASLLRSQYRSFFPGDVCLWTGIGVSFAAVQTRSIEAVMPWWFWFVLGLVVAALLFTMQFTDEEKRQPDAM